MSRLLEYYDECRYAECYNAECRYAECCGAQRNRALCIVSVKGYRVQHWKGKQNDNYNEKIKERAMVSNLFVIIKLQNLGACLWPVL